MKLFKPTKMMKFYQTQLYQRLIERFLYLIHMRPDIAFAVQHLSELMQRPKNSHYKATLRIVRYVKKYLGWGFFFFPAKRSFRLIAYCDSDWAYCPMSRKSVSRCCVKIGDSLISWKLRKQNTISRQNLEVWHQQLRILFS